MTSSRIQRYCRGFIDPISLITAAVLVVGVVSGLILTNVAKNAADNRSKAGSCGEDQYHPCPADLLSGGAACTVSTQCQSGSCIGDEHKVCASIATPRPNGATCNSNTDCTSNNCQSAPGGKFCLAAGESVVAYHALNEACDGRYNLCNSGLECRNNVCAYPLYSNGTACTSNAQCDSGYCLGDEHRVCSPHVTPAPTTEPTQSPYINGTPCTNDTQCKSGHCIGGKDEPKSCGIENTSFQTSSSTTLPTTEPVIPASYQVNIPAAVNTPSTTPEANPDNLTPAQFIPLPDTVNIAFITDSTGGAGLDDPNLVPKLVAQELDKYNKENEGKTDFVPLKYNMVGGYDAKGKVPAATVLSGYSTSLVANIIQQGEKHPENPPDFGKAKSGDPIINVFPTTETNVVVFMLGTNDTSCKLTPQNCKNTTAYDTNMDTMMNYFTDKQPDQTTQFVLIKPPPLIDPTDPNHDQLIQNLNVDIQQKANTNPSIWTAQDMRGTFMSPSGQLQTQYYTSDNIHPNIPGSQKMAENIAATIIEMYNVKGDKTKLPEDSINKLSP